MPKLSDVIKPNLVKRLKKTGISNFLTKLDTNKSHQSAIWSNKTYTVDPANHVYTTIQEHFSNRLIESLKLPVNGVVVDIGCFIGEKLWHVDKTNKYLGIGVDLAIPSLEAAQHIDRFGHKFIAADMENLPFKDNVVDLMLVFDVIEHLSHLETGISETARVLRPQGRILLHFPIRNNKFSLFWLKQQLFPKAALRDYANVGHTFSRMPDSNDVIKLLDKNGLQVEKTIYYNSFFVHFFDRELSQILGKIYSLFTRKTVNSETQNYQLNKNSNSLRNIFAKFVVPIFEFISFPDKILSYFNIGNTCFILAKKASMVNYYRNNQEYTDFLSQATPDNFDLYTKSIVELLTKKTRFLDVGCGAGNVVDSLVRSQIDAYGLEISATSISKSKKKKGKFYDYDGVNIPFKNNYFDAVGSWNVLEHVDSVTQSLSEMSRILKSNGYLIIGCPNFISITNSYHHRTSGMGRKINNFLITLRKTVEYVLNTDFKIEKFEPVNRKDFMPDDDAVNLTNLLDILKWARQNNYSVIRSYGALYESQNLISKLRRYFPIKYLSGGVFVVLRKN